MPKKKMEVEYFKSVIGKQITIDFYHSSVTGKLVNVNPKNLTLYIENDEGNVQIIPYRAKHIYLITVHDVESNRVKENEKAKDRAWIPKESNRDGNIN